MSPLSPDFRHRKRIVLVVDDDTAFRRSVCEAIEEAGHVALGAGAGRDAIECLAGSAITPDLILLDLEMPGMDGVALKGWLEQDAKFKRIPVLVITAHPKAALSRPARILRKPIGFDELMTEVGAVLDPESGSSAPQVH